MIVREQHARRSTEALDLRRRHADRGQLSRLLPCARPRVRHRQREPVLVRGNRIERERRTIAPQGLLAFVPEQLVGFVGHHKPRLGERSTARLEHDIVVDRDEGTAGEAQHGEVDRPAVGRLAGQSGAE